MQKRRWAAGSWLAMGVAGCGGAAREAGTGSSSGSLTATPEVNELPSPGVKVPEEVALSAPGSCDALLAALQADLFVRTRQQAERARQWPYSDPTPERYQGGVTLDTAPEPALGAAAFEEGDVVKADRDHLYLLDREGETQRLAVVRVAPGQPLAVLATVAIEGAPLELLARDGRVLVFSRIEGVLPELYEELPEYEPVYTKLTLLDFNTAPDTEPPYVERELYVEGEYVFARQRDGVARAVIQHVPKLLLDAPLLSDTDILGRDRPQAQIDAQVDTWIEITDASIASSGLDAYLPGVYERHGGVLVARAPSCDSTFVPEAGRAVPGALSVFSLHLDATDLDGRSGVDVGASASAPLSSFTVFGYPDGIALDPGGAVIHQMRHADGPDEAPRTESHLHVFELEGTRARYAAAGSVAGYVTTVDRRPGMLRLLGGQALYVEDRFRGHERRALSLAVDGERLTELGSMVIETANDALGAVHIVGDHAYLYTSNVVGPGFGPATMALVALDLSDPAAPRETGRLSLPPSSGDLAPVPGERLLSLGAGLEPDGVTYHPELWSFDVAGAPTLGTRYAWPSASSVPSDPRALAFSPDGARMGVPVSGSFTSSFDIIDLSASGLTRVTSFVPENTEPTLVQCLELHGVPTDPESIAALEADPPRLALELFQCNLDWPRPYVQRGLLRADDAIVLSYDYRESRWTAAIYALTGVDAGPLSQIEL